MVMKDIMNSLKRVEDMIEIDDMILQETEDMKGINDMITTEMNMKDEIEMIEEMQMIEDLLMIGIMITLDGEMTVRKIMKGLLPIIFGFELTFARRKRRHTDEPEPQTETKKRKIDTTEELQWQEKVFETV